MDVRPLVGAHRPASARRPGRPPAVPAIPIARAALPDDDALYYEDTEPAEPGSEEADRPGSARLRHQPSERPPALNFGVVFRHHAPVPPAPPVRLPEGVANPFTFDTLRHPKSFPRRRPASHRISRSPGTPSMGPAEPSRQRPETARQEGRGQRPGTGRAQLASQGSAALPRERPATARADTRAHRPSTARADGRPSTARTDTRAAASAHEHAADAPRPPAGRPQTARTLSAVSEQKSEDQRQVRWSAFLRSNRYTSRPISQVETCGSLVPAGVDPKVIQTHMGEYEQRVNAVLHPEIVRTEVQTRMLNDFAELKEAILFRKPLPPSASSELGIRATTPVKWAEIEPAPPIVQGEQPDSKQRLGSKALNQVDKATRPLSAKTPRTKYGNLYPPLKSNLRPQSARTRQQQRATPQVDRPAAVPIMQIETVQTSIARVAAADEEDFGMDEESLGTFLTQARPIESCRPLKSGHGKYVEPVKPKHEHLEPRRVNQVIDNMPLACDGRLVISTDVKRVLEKRQMGLKGRVIRHTTKSKIDPRDDVILRNKDHIETPASKQEKIHRHAEGIRARQIESAQRRDALEQEFEQLTLEKIHRHSLAMARKKAAEEKLRREDDQRHMLAVMVFAFKTSRVFYETQRWREHKPLMMRRRWAVLVIEKYYLRHKSNEFSKRRAEALFKLAIVFGRAIRFWRERRKHKKIDMIKLYLKEVGNFAKIQVAVKRFRLKIVRAQNYIRKSLACNHARYELLELQWSKVDSERRKMFEQHRELLLSALMQKVKVRLDLKGNAKGALDAKMRLIESYCGIKKRKETVDELEARRRHYCEYFLPAEMQSLMEIAPVVKRRMLEMYVKKSRQRYTHQWEDYKKRVKTWEELRRSQESIKAGSLDLIHSLGGGHGSQYLAKALDKYAFKLERPEPPAPNIVLPSDVMRQVLEKALAHTERIVKGKVGSKGVSIFTSNVPPPKKVPSLL